MAVSRAAAVNSLMADFALSRSTTIDAHADRVHSHLDDLAARVVALGGPDPDPSAPTPTSRRVSAPTTPGRQQEGRLEDQRSPPHTPSRVEIALEFLVPFKASNVTIFELALAGAGATRVTRALRPAGATCS